MSGRNVKKKQCLYPTDPVVLKERALETLNRIKTPAPLKAMTPGHKVLLKKLGQKHHDLTFVVGPAGTGKTYISVRKGIEQFQNGDYDKIIISRPNVGAGDDLGFLPGDINAKMEPWVAPIRDVFLEHYTLPAFTRMMEMGEIEIVALCHIRGRTFKNALVIVDEGQNMTPAQMKALLTRLGEGSRMIITGDTEQYDRVEGGVSGLADIVKRIERQEAAEQALPAFITNGEPVIHDPAHRWSRIGVVRMDRRDIVRHPVIDLVLELYAD